MGDVTNERFVRVRVLASLFEGQQAQGLLKDAGIECMLVSFRDTALDGLYQATKGYGEIRVPEGKRTQAEAILAELPATVEVSEEQVTSEALQSPLPAVEPERPAGALWPWLLSVAAVVLVGLLLYLVARVTA